MITIKKTDNHSIGEEMGQLAFIHINAENVKW